MRGDIVLRLPAPKVASLDFRRHFQRHSIGATLCAAATRERDYFFVCHVLVFLEKPADSA
jgi:hypothetical protein